MIIAERRSASIALFFLLLAAPVFAQQPRPWDAPAFKSDAKDLLAAAEKVEAGDFPMVLLLDEAEYVVEADGRTRSTTRLMVRVIDESAVEYNSTVEAPWSPWYDERPTIEARVVTKEGTVHHLDPSAIVEAPAPSAGVDIFSDVRILRAPLPAVAPGSVIEYVVRGNGKNPLPGGGIAVQYYFGSYSPVERTRVIIDTPSGIEPRVVNETGVEPRIDNIDGRRRVTYEAGRIEGKREVEQYLPYDVSPFRYVAFSTGTSWQAIASQYADIVAKQIAGSDLQKRVKAAIGNATDRKEIVARLLAAIQKDIRYAGVEVGEGTIIPRTPKQVLANRYGDCKDKATLLVAMLREAGVSAHVALLNAGNDFDISADLPGLSVFNHAIVVVDGDPAIWVDPTDVYSRASELPQQDQGRLALIAKAETTALTRIPEAEATANLYRERRTFYLPEHGKARVVEITEPTGASEAWLRRWSEVDAKQLRENLEEYAKSAYVATSLGKFEIGETRDLTKPFRITLDVPESASGKTNNGDASVAINLPALLTALPEELRDWEEPQPGEDAAKANEKKREHDFLFPSFGVREWAYRLVPPAGYVARTLPPSEATKLGATTLSRELRTTDDGAIEATFRFAPDKRRLTAAEFEETRIAISKFMQSDALTLGFELTGQTRLNAGDVRGAIEEFRRLSALHPKEAQHHIEVSRALLVGGLGDAAREEARRAVAVEPKNALAHQALGHALLHDVLGREYRKGIDLPAAIAALRKAKELDPDDFAIRFALARALTYNDEGIRFGHGARLAEAAAEYEAMAKELGDEGKSAEPDLTLVYTHLGRYADVRELAKTLADEQERDMASIVATITLDGIDAGLRELNAYDQQTRRAYAGLIAELLFKVRLYPQTAAMLEAATQGLANAPEQRVMIELLRKVRRHEDEPVDEGPKGMVAKLLRAAILGDMATLKALLPELTDENDKWIFNARTQLATIGVPPAVLADLVSVAIQIQQDGDDATGYRLRLRPAFAVAGANDVVVMFVRRENDQWRIAAVASGKDERFGGPDALRKLVDAGQFDAARRWAAWIREEVKGGTSDDPLDGSPFAALWPKTKTNATDDEVRLAAAVLAEDKTAEPILTAAREQASSESVKAAIDVALANIHQKQKSWPKMVVITERLLAAYPDSPTAFGKHADALIGSGKTDEAVALAQQRLERLPKDPDALRVLSRASATAGKYEDAQTYATQIVDELRPTQNDYRTAAWLALFTGAELDRALEHAERASRQNTTPDAASLNTLAALYAETGKNLEARQMLLQSLDNSGRTRLEGEEWYVIGRLAENYGVSDFAAGAYQKVGKNRGGATVYELAQRRLAGLAKGK